MEELDPNQGRALLHQLGSLEKMIGVYLIDKYAIVIDILII
jgi:hypothetical protein